MSKSKKQLAPTNYVNTVRDGAIAANIFRGNTPDGHTYLYFELSRCWKSQTGTREVSSKKFYDRNSEALQRVVAAASDWIKQHPELADGPIEVEAAPLSKVA